ncbi:MAG: CapA family protein [Pseudomonadota bacterium]
MPSDPTASDTQPSAAGRARIAWGGDIDLGGRLHGQLRAVGGPQRVLGGIAALREADLRIASLACVIATQGEAGVDKGENAPTYHRARPEMAAVLTEASIDIVATANGHSGDYGPDALLENLHNLQLAGIGAAGSGATPEAAFTPVVRLVNGVRIALFSVDATQPRFAALPDRPGHAWLPPQSPDVWRDIMTPLIDAAHRRAHVVLVAVHWRRRPAAAPDEETIALGQALIDAGADAVLGASSHAPRGVARYRERPIVYDAGAFCCEPRPGASGTSGASSDGGVFTLDVTPYGVERVVFHPIRMHGDRSASRSAADADAEAVAQRLAAECEALGTPTLVEPGGTCVIRLRPPPRQLPPIVGPAAPRVLPLAERGPARHLPACNETRADWTIDRVPAEARIAPLQFGPLRLLGLRCTPDSLDRRETLWVDSYWCTDAPVSADLRLQFRAVPTLGERMPPWGDNSEHDPCDWMWPTSRWQPGVIYRDRCGVRPPSTALVSEVLRLEAQVIGDGPIAAPALLPVWCRLQLSPGPQPADTPVPLPLPLLSRDGTPTKTWRADQLAQITGGRWLVPPAPGWFARSVVRGPAHVAMRTGPTLFVAASASDVQTHENYSKPRLNAWDHHALIAKLQPCLAGAIVRHVPDGLATDFPLLQVDDPIGALIALGRAARERFKGKVVAVTGTAGKSSTVATVAHLLPPDTRVLSTIDNYNSRVGVPAMLASLAENDDVCVLEMAQSALWMSKGPISLMARPHVSIVTEIALSQTDMIRTLESTADIKSRIFQGLLPGGVAIFGEHIPSFDRVREAASRWATDRLIVGTSTRADVRILDMQATPEGCRVRLSVCGLAVDGMFPVASAGLVRNAAMALAAVHAMGFDVRDAAGRMASVRLPHAVLAHSELHTRKGVTATLIDDSWNAEVLSMINAFDYTSRYQAPAPAAPVLRRIAVLGRIVNLGRNAEAMHRSLAEPLLASRIECVLTHGDEMHWLREALPADRLGPHFETAEAVVRYLADELRDGDLLLLKGDRVQSDFGDIARQLRTL